MQSKINIQAYIVILPNKLQKNEGVFIVLLILHITFTTMSEL